MRILFVCTGNTCRSPIAEGLARRMFPQHEWHSAGVMPTADLQPLTAKVLAEEGIDTTGFETTDVTALRLGSFDHVVLIGETARNYSGRIPEGTGKHFWYIFDPYHAVGSEDEQLEIYREVREEIRRHILELAEELGLGEASA